MKLHTDNILFIDLISTFVLFQAVFVKKFSQIEAQLGLGTPPIIFYAFFKNLNFDKKLANRILFCLNDVRSLQICNERGIIKVCVINQILDFLYKI